MGIADHLSIGSGTTLGARSGVITDVPAGVHWGGFPARPFRDWLKTEVLLARLVREGRRGGKDSKKPEDDK